MQTVLHRDETYDVSIHLLKPEGNAVHFKRHCQLCKPAIVKANAIHRLKHVRRDASEIGPPTTVVQAEMPLGLRIEALDRAGG